ncbi:MAG: cytochrome c3 family protein [Nitrospinae bacterium]|nr:cytochrome c3 family protein [Nitrospinota bacterium]
MRTSTAVILAVTIVSAVGMFTAFAGAGRTQFLPAPLASAHARFGYGCPLCHEPWRGPTQTMCLKCHARGLYQDSHPSGKLASSAKAQTPPELRGLTCMDCHGEHRPTAPKAYTGPDGLCEKCHEPGQINQDHSRFSGDSCVNPGCHTYHSSMKPDKLAESGNVTLKAITEICPKPAPAKQYAITAEEVVKMRSSRFFKDNLVVAAQYEISAHYGTSATCAKCHAAYLGVVDEKPEITVCAPCHETQVDTYVTGRHGAPDMAVSPVFSDSARMGCGACHDAHNLRLEKAGGEACQTCHKETHAANFEKSGHNRYLTDPVFAEKALKGVNCAGCHMPRLMELNGHTDHNETVSASSKERMALDVCSRCHGLGFSLQSLYDAEVVKSAFTYRPLLSVEGLTYLFELAEKRQNINSMAGGPQTAPVEVSAGN